MTKMRPFSTVAVAVSAWQLSPNRYNFDRHVREQVLWYDLKAQAVAHFARFIAVEE
jgi:hypothetical protein